MPIRFTNLSQESRRIIWRNFCDRVPGGMDITEAELDRLSRHEINGRQIKNIVKSAEALAAHAGRRLDAAQLEEFTAVQAQFEKDWLGFVDVE